MTPVVNKTAYQQFEIRIYIGCLAILILVVIGLGWKVNADYNAAIQTTVAQTKNLVLAIEAHVVDTIDKMNAPLTAVAETIATKSSAGALSPKEIKSILTSPLLPNTASYWIMFIDPNGNAVASSNDLPVAGVSYADREYFKAQRARNTGQVFIGDPTIGRVSKTRNYFVSKRVENSNHEFLGVIVACVDSASFARVLERSLYEKTLSTTLVNTHAKIIARAPLYEQSFGRDISSSDLFVQLAKSRVGTYRSISLIDKGLRVYSYRAIEKYPLIVSVGMQSPLFIDTLTNDALDVAGGLFTALLILLLGSRYALESFRYIENYATEQRALNFKLDAAKNEIEISVRRARMIADNMPALVAYIDSDQRYQFRNTFYEKVPGINYEQMIGRTMLEVFGPEIHAAVANEVDRALKGESIIFERELLNKDGKTIYLRYQYSPDKNKDGVVVGFYTMVLDVTDMKEVQHQLMALSRIDALTGLPNRTALYERIAEVIARTARHNHGSEKTEKIACLFLDIDRFKVINDTYGHNCGDAVLREFSSRIKDCIRQSDMASRLAGDEFVILLEGLEEYEGATSVAMKIIKSMSVPFITEYGNLSVTTSIGIAISSDLDATADSLLKDADAALYDAKKNGRNTFAIKTSHTVTL